MDVAAYLQRMGYRGSLDPTLDTLKRLQLAHLSSVPFENLDIPLGQPIVLSLPLLYEKIVERRRGGFCYELNGLFAWMLGELGFNVAQLSARVFNDGKPGPDFDHMLLRVDQEEPHIADVGFGDCFRVPMPLAAGIRSERGQAYRLLAGKGKWQLQHRAVGSDWNPQYVFSERAQPLEAFAPMCHYQQTSPDSPFTRKTICSRATPEGRISLANSRLIITQGNRKEESIITSAAAYRALLLEHFDLELDGDRPVERLLVIRS